MGALDLFGPMKFSTTGIRAETTHLASSSQCPTKGENTVPFPSKGNGGVIDHVGHNMPIVFGRVSGGAMIKAVMGRSDGQQDGSFPMPRAHFAIILA